MGKSGFDYNSMVEQAMRGVVRQAVGEAAEHGMPGNHHMLVSFRTDAPGVEIPGYLRQSYPQEMTIVLQHQYWDLEAGPDALAVTLNFNRISERLIVPYVAITAFADPSVQFGLQFRVRTDEDAPPAEAAGEAEAAPAPEPAADAAKPAGEVVALDAFRKKK